MKTCTGCHQEKPLDQFHQFTHRKDGRVARCKDCTRERNRLDHQRRQATRSKRDEVELARLYPTKTCSQCQQDQPRNHFARATAAQDGLHPECKGCARQRNRDYRDRNREKLKAKKKAEYQADREGYLAKGRAWKEANRERHLYLQRRSHLKNTYDLTPNQYEMMLERQGGVCAICKESPQERRLHVDHDHACCPGKRSCGKCIRGLLCYSCNRTLGWYESRRSIIETYITTKEDGTWL